MGEMRAELGERNQVSVAHDPTGARWVFLIEIDKDGRRHLGDPHGAVDDQTYEPGLIRQACETAKSEAIRAGLVEY